MNAQEIHLFCPLLTLVYFFLHSCTRGIRHYHILLQEWRSQLLAQAMVHERKEKIIKLLLSVSYYQNIVIQPLLQVAAILPSPSSYLVYANNFLWSCALYKLHGPIQQLQPLSLILLVQRSHLCPQRFIVCCCCCFLSSIFSSIISPAFKEEISSLLSFTNSAGTEKNWFSLLIPLFKSISVFVAVDRISGAIMKEQSLFLPLSLS